MTRISDSIVRNVHTVDRKATVFECIQVMVEKNIGSLIVTDGPTICGIFTERDYLKRIALEDRTSKTTRVEEVMTTRLICADPNQTSQECMTIMTQKRIRHLPVMEDQHLVGILSIGDLVKRHSSELEAEVRYLHDFVDGKYPV